MCKYFFFPFIFFLFSIYTQAQNTIELPKQLQFENGILIVDAYSSSGKDSFFKLLEKQTKKTVFWEVFGEKGILKRNYAIRHLPKGTYFFQFALDGKALYGDIVNTEDNTTFTIRQSTDYKKPYFNIKIEDNTLLVNGFFAQDKEVEISIKNENELEDVYYTSIILQKGELNTQYVLNTFDKGDYIIRAKLKDKTFVRSFTLK